MSSSCREGGGSLASFKYSSVMSATRSTSRTMAEISSLVSVCCCGVEKGVWLSCSRRSSALRPMEERGLRTS